MSKIRLAIASAAVVSLVGGAAMAAAPAPATPAPAAPAASTPAPAAPTPAAAAPAAKPYYSTNSTMGELNANPATAAIIKRNLPDLPAPPPDMEEMARGMTFQQVKDFIPDVLTEAVLKKLDEDLAKVPAPSAAPAAPAAAPATPAPAAAPAAPATPRPQ